MAAASRSATSPRPSPSKTLHFSPNEGTAFRRAFSLPSSNLLRGKVGIVELGGRPHSQNMMGGDCLWPAKRRQYHPWPAMTKALESEEQVRVEAPKGRKEKRLSQVVPRLNACFSEDGHVHVLRIIVRHNAICRGVGRPGCGRQRGLPFASEHGHVRGIQRMPELQPGRRARLHRSRGLRLSG